MAKPKKDKPVYFTIRKMVEPATGEEVGCLVPDGWVNQRVMRERMYRTNDLVRATLTKPRSVKFHRLMHQLGIMVCQSIEGFENLDSHSAIKRLQRETGLFCEEQEIDASPIVTAILDAAEMILGQAARRMLAAVLPEIRTIKVSVAQSIAFDSLDEADFRQLWQGICEHIISTYWQSMTVDEIGEMAELMPQREAA